MTDPRHFSSKIKRDAWKRARGHCDKCTAKLTTGNIIYDHVIPWDISHDSSLKNCQVLCWNCNETKTYRLDAPPIARVHRIFDRAIGIERPKQKLPGGKDSRLSKTIRGAVVTRQSQSEKHKVAMKNRYGGEI